MRPAGMEHDGRIHATAGVGPHGNDPISPAGRGVLLGALNVLVIGIALGASMGHGDVLSVAFFVSIVAILPAVVTGACLGALAGSMRAQPRWLRVPLLLVPALALVAALAMTFGLVSFAAVSAIPTSVAVLILERWTRERVEPVVPPARAHREASSR